jgi:hypothetical protein
MPRVGETKSVKIEMVAKLVAKRIQKCSERRDFLAHRSPHPQADQHALGMVIPEQFSYPVFSGSKRSGCEHSDATARGLIKLRGFCQKLSTGTADIRSFFGLHGYLNGFSNCGQKSVLRQIERPNPITFQITCAVCGVWWGVR